MHALAPKTPERHTEGSQRTSTQLVLTRRRNLRRTVQALEDKRSELSKTIREAQASLLNVQAAIAVKVSEIASCTMPPNVVEIAGSPQKKVFPIPMTPADIQARLTPSPVKAALAQAWEERWQNNDDPAAEDTLVQRPTEPTPPAWERRMTESPKSSPRMHQSSLHQSSLHPLSSTLPENPHAHRSRVDMVSLYKPSVGQKQQLTSALPRTPSSASYRPSRYTSANMRGAPAASLEPPAFPPRRGPHTRRALGDETLTKPPGVGAASRRSAGRERAAETSGVRQNIHPMW